MKKVIVALITVVAFAGVACAKDELTLKGGLKFNHKAHKAQAGGCKNCHPALPMKDATAGDIDKSNAVCAKCHAKK